jgi:hypothetical protein
MSTLTVATTRLGSRLFFGLFFSLFYFYFKELQKCLSQSLFCLLVLLSPVRFMRLAPRTPTSSTGKWSPARPAALVGAAQQTAFKGKT